MPYHPVTKEITDLLIENHCEYQAFEHPPATTSEESASYRPGFTLHQGAKALIVRFKNADKARAFAMLVFPADLKFDSKKAKALLGTKDLSFATPEEVAMLTGGVQVGGVPPLGNLFKLPVFADESLFGNEMIVFNAGDRSFSVAMRSEDYKKLVDPQVAQFTFQ